MDMSAFLTDWIWLPDWSPADDAEPRIACFRRTFALEKGSLPEHWPLHVSADSRYKLFVNGCFVQEGPQKALDLKEWFFDSADIAAFLREGENVLAVEVLRYPAPSASMGGANCNDSLYRTPTPGLYIADVLETPLLGGRSGWRCALDREIRVFGEEARPAPIHAQEDVEATGFFKGWKCPDYDDTTWQPAAPRLMFDVPRADAPGNLVARTIPAQRHTEKRFEGVTCVREGASPDDLKRRFDRMLRGETAVTIPANSRAVVEISAGAEECGYLEYAFAGGKGARIATLCSECYAYPQPPRKAPFGDAMMPSAPRKGDRTDWKNGQLFGHTSFYKVAGCGTEAVPETYEPYWFRTFRYIQLTIETQSEPLVLCAFTYRETGYPLDVRTSFAASDESFRPIWDISVRTLERCMHETYFDCPFYEQLQYAMDSRSEILYTYAISADDRLARQCMEAFRRSQRPDGMTNSDAPVVRSNVIPGFSIYYLLMVHDHMMYFGDKALVKRHIPALDAILAFFDRSLTDLGLVGKVGGPLMRAKYWSFIDWSIKWNDNLGVPPATNKGTGSITMESLLYLYGLQKAAELADYVDRSGLAEEYRARAERLRAAIRKNCLGTYANGQSLIQDGPGVDDYSVHCQVFAALTGVVTPEEGKAMLQATVGNPDLAQSSVSFMFYLFRALELCGWYEQTDVQWELWRQMVRDNLTTCVENDTDARSDCHAWASLLCYELPAVTLGVRPTAPGFASIHIAPQMGALDAAKGDVITPKGIVHVEWTRGADGSCQLKYTLPDGIADQVEASHA